MTTPAKQRQRAARLFLMASAAYGRCGPKLAERLIEKSNECTDRAAGLPGDGDKALQNTEWLMIDEAHKRTCHGTVASNAVEVASNVL
jgi:hypothetical protein